MFDIYDPRTKLPIMSRLHSVDVLRTVAIVAVIAIHTSPLQSAPIGASLDIATAINQLARFAVPLFFVLSGYFWACKLNGEKDIWIPTLAMIKRIAFIFIAWSVIYLLPMNIYDSFSYGALGPIKRIYWNMREAVNHPLVTLMQGTKFHLWFLLSLLWSLSISALFLRLRLKSLLVVFAVALYLIGLAGKAYHDTPLGFYPNLNLRDGPFFSLIFFVTGYFLQSYRSRESWFSYGLAIAFFGMLLHFTELLWVQKNWGTTMSQDYVLGTYFFGVGIAMVALSNTTFLRWPIVASIGPLVLGIYASHVAFIEFLAPLKYQLSGNKTWDIPFMGLVFMLSYALSFFLSKFSVTKRLVA